MPTTSSSPGVRLWTALSAIPIILSVVFTSLCTIAYTQQWGGSTLAAYMMSLFAAEISLVLAAAGLLCYLRITPKTTTAKWLARANWLIVSFAFLFGLFLFLG